ncbi:MAG: hypothetical protein KC492_14965 [Myxococcales bacterium]|nr:hypothetical protein [Myxococcales bacterium]
MYVDDEPEPPAPPRDPHVEAESAESFLDRRGPRLLMLAFALATLLVCASVLGYERIDRSVRTARCEQDMLAAEEWQRLIESCGAPLPPSSAPVPPEVPRGVSVTTSPSDWKQPATRCGAREFSVSGPQLHSFRWERISSLADGGEVIIEADLDGDGAVDHKARFAVICDHRGCLVGDAMEDGYCDPAPD